MPELQKLPINALNIKSISFEIEAYANAFASLTLFQEQMQARMVAFQKMFDLMESQIIATNKVVEAFIKPHIEATNALAEILKPSLTATNALMEFIKPSIMVRENLLALHKLNFEMAQIFNLGLLVAEVVNQQLQAMENFREMITNSFFFPKFDLDIIEGHIIGEEVKPKTQIIPVPPQAIQVYRKYALLKSPLGISFFEYGGFIYKRKTLRYFSRYNSAGKFLFLLLSHIPHVVTYGEIGKEFHISLEEDRGSHDAHSLSDIIKAFKKAFLRNGLFVELHNERTLGYTLLGIKQLFN